MYVIIRACAICDLIKKIFQIENEKYLGREYKGGNYASKMVGQMEKTEV